MTENSGLAFGTLGLGLLLRGSREKQLKNAIYGLFLLTIALNARAGAFFVLPVLVLWTGLIFRGSIGTWKAVGTGILAVLLGFGSNFVLVWAIGAPNGVPFSNYSSTFYGLASGNKGWAQVMADHPGVQGQDVLRLALEKFREDPNQLLLGMVRSYGDYFNRDRGAFSFLKLAGSGSGVNALMWILTGFGMLVVTRLLKSPAYSFLLAGAAGIFASVGLVPPIAADSMRVYAATIPLTACLVSVGAAAPRHLLKWWRTNPQSAADTPGASHLLMPLSIGLLVSTVILPLIVFLLGNQKAMPTGGQCAPGQQRFATIAGSGSFVKLIADQDAEESYVPTVRVSDFKRGIRLGSLYPLLDQELLTLREGQSIGVTSNSYVFAEPNPLNPGMQELCGTPPKNAWLMTYRFFYVDTGKQGPGSAATTILSKHPQMTKIIRKSFGLGLLVTIFTAMMTCLSRVRMRAKTRIILAGGTTLVIPGVLVYLHSSANLPLRWQRVPVPVKQTSPKIGFCYILPLGVNWMSQAQGVSPAQIFEDGVALRFPNAMHEYIRKKGEGRFSVWEGYLYFSSSDNTDPRANGRRYEIYWPSPIAPPIRWLSYALSLIGGSMLVFIWIKEGKKRAVDLAPIFCEPTREAMSPRISDGLGPLSIIFYRAGNFLGTVWPRSKRWMIAVTPIVALIPGMLIYLHSSASFPLRWQRIPVQSKLASHETGFCYIVPLGVNWMSQAKRLSPAEIFEDGVPLRFPNAMHEDIRKKGEGRFSVWEGYLYLSTSDNTDPRTNGRRYEIYWPTPIAPPIRWLSYALSLGGGFMLIFLLVRESRR